MAWRLYEYEPPQHIYYQLLKDRKFYLELSIECHKNHDRYGEIEATSKLHYIEGLIEKWRRGWLYDWK